MGTLLSMQVWVNLDRTRLGLLLPSTVTPLPWLGVTSAPAVPTVRAGV